jgi:carboxylesterase type B
VVVTLNYRLGPLGFLVTDSPSGGNRTTQGNGGMNGFGDIVNALKWLDRHVGAFGGDQDQTTLMGDGCGAAAVCALAVCPMAKGLFQAMSVQSGVCTNNGHGVQSQVRGALPHAEAGLYGVVGTGMSVLYGGWEQMGAAEDTAAVVLEQTGMPLARDVATGTSH